MAVGLGTRPGDKFAKRAEFLRTPNTTDRMSWWTTIRANWAEPALAVLGVVGIAVGLSHVDGYAGPLPGTGHDDAVTPARTLRAGVTAQCRARQVVVVSPRAAMAPSSTARSYSVIGSDSRRRGISHSATAENTQQPMM